MSEAESLYNRLVAEGDDPDAPRRVDVEHRGDRAVVTFDESDRLNVLSAPLVRQLRGTLEALVVDHEVRSVVLTGRDPGFSAGGDLTMMETATANLSRPEGVADVSRWIRREFGGIARLIAGSDTIFVAAINGPAARVGLAWALVCDVAVASERAGVRPPRPDPRGRHQLGADPAAGIPRGACLLPARRAHRCQRGTTAGPGSTGRRPRPPARHRRSVVFTCRGDVGACHRDDQAPAARRGRRRVARIADHGGICGAHLLRHRRVRRQRAHHAGCACCGRSDGWWAVIGVPRRPAAVGFRC